MCNCFIIHTVRKRHTYFQKENVDGPNDKGSPDQSYDTSKNKHSKHRESQLVIMLLLVAFALLILTMPQYVRYVVYLIVDNRANVEVYATYLLLYNLTQKLWFTNSMCNIFLYAIGGSKFRQDVKDLLCKSFWKRPDTNAIVASFVSSP